MKKVAITDEMLVQRVVQNKDEKAFGVLYDRYHNQVYSKCITFTNDVMSAEDLSHDIFLKTYLKLNSFDGKSKFSTWFFSITYRECINHTRSKNKESKALSEHYFDLDSERTKIFHSDSEEKLLNMKVIALKEVLAHLEPDDKVVLLMKYQDDMTIVDIQAILGMKKSAVKMRLLRARERALILYKKIIPTNSYD